MTGGGAMLVDQTLGVLQKIDSSRSLHTLFLRYV